MKIVKAMDVQEILKEIDNLLAWDKEKIREALYDDDDFRKRVFALDVDDLNEMTQFYCYEDERKQLDEYSLNDVCREFGMSKMVDYLIKNNASKLMLSMINDSDLLHGKWVRPEMYLPAEGIVVLFIPGPPMKPRVYEGYRIGDTWRCTTSVSSFSGKGAVIYWTLRPRLPEELNNRYKHNL